MEYNVGDIVRLVVDAPERNHELKIGDVGIIVDINGGLPPIGVDWGRNVNGHDCIGRAIYGNGWYVGKTDIELAETRDTEDFDVVTDEFELSQLL